jgi:DNA-binding MarR family transcriptional regulator
MESAPEPAHEPPHEPAQEPPHELTTALEHLVRLFRRLSSPSEHSLTAVATLTTLERSGPCRLTELAGREGVTQPAMTQLVSRLEGEGLVARGADAKDGRVVQVRITDAGRAALSNRRAVRGERLAELLSRLSPAERSALTAALPAIEALARLAPEDRPADPHPIPRTRTLHKGATW